MFIKLHIIVNYVPLQVLFQTRRLMDKQKGPNCQHLNKNLEKILWTYDCLLMLIIRLWRIIPQQKSQLCPRQKNTNSWQILCFSEELKWWEKIEDIFILEHGRWTRTLNQLPLNFAQGFQIVWIITWIWFFFLFHRLRYSYHVSCLIICYEYVM